MRSIAALPLIAALGYALPQDATNCVTVTSEVIVPTSTATYIETAKTSITETGAQDLGTFTDVVRVSLTTTLETLTSTSTSCTASGTITNGITSTVYTTAGASAPADVANSSSAAPTLSAYKRELGLAPRQDACTVTSVFTTTYGQTYTFVTESSTTSTVTFWTAYTQATVTSTSVGGTAYAIATATATTEALCGPTANGTTAATSTVTQDARCAPSALSSSYDGFGLEYSEAVTLGGATYETTADDASQCCQLCAEADSCAASTWDIRTGKCVLAFPTEYGTGALSCGEGFLVFYDAGPDSPMAPGTGLFVGTVCGNVQYANAPPDDGT